MERYTDINHPQYIPGTYSIYSSAVIQKRRQKTSIYSDDSIFENYRYIPHRPLEDIPELKTRYGVILLPQPTNSINDPLNWSLRRKSLHFFMLLLITAFTSALANDISAPQDSINEITGISYDALNNSAGLLFVAIALSTWLYAPLASMCGRRITYLLGLLFALVGSIIFATLKNTGQAFGSQILVGFGEGSNTAQVQLSLSSIFFRHQLGSVITIYVMATSLGTYLGPLIANFISNSKGFRWVGWSGAIASGILLVMVFFLVEEDSFDYSRFTHHRANLTLNMSLKRHGISSNEDNVDLGYNDTRLPLWKRFSPLRLSERASESLSSFCRQYVRLLALNIRCFWFPPILFSGLTWGFQEAVLTFYLTTEDTELYDPPFNYSSSRVALMNIPCIIGTFVGCIYAGSLTDYFILWMARRNDGIVQSEFRLYFAFLSGIIGSIGLLMFGFGVSKQLNWRVTYVGLGLIAYLYASVGTISLLYIIDTYDQLILESLVANAVINNMIGCIFTFACSPWLDSSGTQNTYIVLACLNLFIMFLAAPYIIWGKKWRKWTKASYVRLIQAR